MPRKTATEPVPEKMYRSISEVSELLDVKPHVLRYWETQFGTLKPRKNRAGNRMYRPEEIKLSDVIRALEGSLSPVSHLHDEGYQCRAAHEVWHTVEESTQKILDGVTIGDLAARELEYDRIGARYAI